MLTREEIAGSLEWARENAFRGPITVPAEKLTALYSMALALLDIADLEPSTAQSPGEIVGVVRISRADYDKMVEIENLVPDDDGRCTCGHRKDVHFDDSDGMITLGPCQDGRTSGVRCACEEYSVRDIVARVRAALREHGYDSSIDRTWARLGNWASGSDLLHEAVGRVVRRVATLEAELAEARRRNDDHVARWHDLERIQDRQLTLDTVAMELADEQVRLRRTEQERDDAIATAQQRHEAALALANELASEGAPLVKTIDELRAKLKTAEQERDEALLAARKNQR